MNKKFSPGEEKKNEAVSEKAGNWPVLLSIFAAVGRSGR